MVKPLGQTCRCCKRHFDIPGEDHEYYTTLEIPPPTCCPQCRLMRRMAWCNEGTLYSASCARCGKHTISQLPADDKRKQWCVNCWWNKPWDALDYGREPDFSRSLFAQLHELEVFVPHACVSTDITNENSEYTHHAGQEKNCYLIFHATFCENCYYGYGVKKAVDCVDVHNCFESELCYECVDVDQCYNLGWCQDCQNCSESWFLRDCIGCADCTLCVGLRNQRYCFLNRQLSKPEYEHQIQALRLDSHAAVQQHLETFSALQQNHRWRNLRVVRTEASFGDYLRNAKRAMHCFDCRDIESSCYCYQLQLGSKDCRDVYQFGNHMELCCEGAMIGSNAYNVQFSYLCIWDVANLQYCLDCYTSSDCFLCFGLRHNRFCILNRQYSENEYHTVRKQLIKKMTADGEYGEFMPPQFSQSCYNETTANLWFPKTKSEILQLGWRWRDELPGTFNKQTLTALPDSLKMTPSTITKEILPCTTCHSNYRIIAQELEFHRRQGYSLSNQCFNCRRKRRMQQRNLRSFRAIQCADCGITVPTTIDPGHCYQVVCEKCYESAVSSKEYD